MRNEIEEAGRLLTEVCHAASRQGGWHNDRLTGEAYDDARHDALFPVRIALCHSELSEALEGHRKGIQDDHLPHRKMAEVELADVLIRVCDLAGAMRYDLGAAIAEKLAYNASRQDHTVDARRASGGKAY